MTPSVQNLNARLAAPMAARRRAGTVAFARRTASVRGSGVRIAGACSSYRGGYYLSGR